MTDKDIIQYPIIHNRSYKNQKIFTPRGIMLHSVGTPQPRPEAFADYWNREDMSVSVHAIVSPDKVLQLMPWTYQAWHCGAGPKGSGNQLYIGVEMTEPRTIAYTGGASFVDCDPVATKDFIIDTFSKAVKLFAYLCRKFNFNPATDILSHAEGYKKGVASNHADPDHLFNKYPDMGLSMEVFRMEVLKQMAKDEKEVYTSGQGDNPSPAFVTETRWAKEKGLFLGDGKGNFNWQQAVTREQLAAILYRFSNL